ncbi:unnamed protein product [Notodromas monacha]|uniref:Uncharacterized protein n=1 Tax=Notodromas monacha TaxID=399045 RepID=A0A7R9BZ66_9CRUS|nr:unnamed protein product [Notodromas monacha]CAG0923387.1 unnamed protein product [Notodromas monacha]
MTSKGRIVVLIFANFFADFIAAAPVTYWALGAAPNFFVGDSAVQQTWMDGLAQCIARLLPTSHLKCVNTLISVSSTTNDANLQNLVCRAASNVNNCNNCLTTLGAMPNFFVGDSAVQQTWMDGLAQCIAQFLPSSHLKCVNTLISASTTVTTSDGQQVRTGTVASNGIFGLIRSIISTLNVLDFRWVKMIQAQNCIILANIGLS